MSFGINYFLQRHVFFLLASKVDQIHFLALSMTSYTFSIAGFTLLTNQGTSISGSDMWNHLNAIAQCRGYLNASICAACISNASKIYRDSNRIFGSLNHFERRCFLSYGTHNNSQQNLSNISFTPIVIECDNTRINKTNESAKSLDSQIDHLLTTLSDKVDPLKWVMLLHVRMVNTVCLNAEGTLIWVSVISASMLSTTIWLLFQLNEFHFNKLRVLVLVFLFFEDGNHLKLKPC